MKDRVVKRLVSNMKCGVCGQCYGLDNVNILSHRDDLWFVRVFCDHCETEGLVAAVARESRPAKSASASAAEGAHVLSGPIGMDDVLDMHNLLKDFTGDISDLLSES